MTEVRAIAGINPESNVCCYVGGQDQEEVMQLIEQGLIVVPVTVEKARTMFGEVFEFVEQNPKRDGDAILDKLRASGLSIDGDNAYKRDLLDVVVGAMAFGYQNANPPPADHWGKRFWDIGREYGALPSDAPAIALPMPVMPEQPEDAIDDSWMDGYNAALRMREDCMRAIEAAGLAAPAVVNQQLTTAEPSNMAGMHTLDEICALLMIGKNARTHACVMANITNIHKFARLLHAIEGEFFMAPGEIDPEFPDDQPYDCLLNCWGSNQEQYIEQFRAALARIAQQPGVAPLDDQPYSDPRNGDETFSANGEDWHNYDLLDLLSDRPDLKAGDTVFRAIKHYQDPASFVDHEALISSMNENAGSSDTGEWVDSWPEPGEEAETELTDLLEAWARRHCAPDFHLVRDVTEYTLTAEDLRSHAEGSDHE